MFLQGVPVIFLTEYKYYRCVLFLKTNSAQLFQSFEFEMCVEKVVKYDTFVILLCSNLLDCDTF